MSIETPDNGTSFTIMNLTPDTTYTVNLSAFTGAGEGDFSVSVTNMTIRDRKYFHTNIASYFVNHHFGSVLVN